MTKEKSSRWSFVVLVILAIVLVAVIAYPFSEALLASAVLASAVQPIYERVARRLGGRRQLTATLFTLAVVLIIVIPIASLTTMAVQQGLEAYKFVRTTLESEGVQGLVNQLPGALRDLGQRLMHQLPTNSAGEEQLPQIAGGTKAAAAVGGVVAGAGSAVLQTALMLVAFFFFLLDGQRLVDWLNDVAPLKKGQLSELLGDIRQVSVKVLISILGTAGVQTAAALVGYLIARVPHPFFFALLTFFISFIPAVGAGGCGLALAGLLALSGKHGMAIFLAIWSLVAVGLVDNVARPLFIKYSPGGTEIHGAIIFFALLGGIAVFGPIGLIAGPLIVAFLFSLVRLYKRDFAT